MRVGIRPKLIIELTPEDRAFLEGVSRQRNAPFQEVVRAKALLLASDSTRNVEIAARLDVDPRTISIWRKEFLERGRDGLSDRPRPGRKRSFSP